MSFEAPEREDLVRPLTEHRLLPAAYIFHNARELFSPPKEVDLIEPAEPEGYIFPNERMFPIAPDVETIRVTAFNDYKANFVDEFQPDQVVCKIETVSAILAGVELREKGYKMVMGAISIDDFEDTRRVAEVLSMDFDCPNPLLIRYLQGGAKVASYLLFDTPDKKPFYGVGVGLWMSNEQIDELSN